MSNTFLLILLLIGLIVSLWASQKFNVNAGLIAMAVAWIVGCWLGKITPTALINYWPTSVMFIAITTTLFFGYARENGTLTLFAEKVMYLTRNIKWFPPIALYLISFFIACAGAGAMATQIFMSTVAFAIVAQTGMNPMLALLAVFLGGCGGGGMFWAPEGANRIAYYTGIVSDDAVQYNVIAHSVYTAIVFTIIFFVGYIVFRGWRNKAEVLELKKPAPFNREQKITLAIIGIVVVLVVGSAILKQVYPTALTKKLTTNFSIQFTALIGFLVCFIFRLADTKAVMKRIPWDLILTVGGMTMMIKVGLEFGVTDMVKNVFEGGVSPIVVPFLFLLFAGFISLFANFTVIYPLLFPLIPVVAQATGANSVNIFAMTAFGSMITGMSPFSTGGACCLTGVPDEEQRSKLVPKLLIMAVCSWAIIAILSFTPLFNLFPEILTFS